MRQRPMQNGLINGSPLKKNGNALPEEPMAENIHVAIPLTKKNAAHLNQASVKKRK